MFSTLLKYWKQFRLSLTRSDESDINARRCHNSPYYPRKTTVERDVLGFQGEEFAAQFLAVMRGYKILERNVPVPSGEIDIVAQDADVIVIVEVKTRSNVRFGRPDQSVHAHKRRKMLNSANDYLRQKKWRHRTCRFDIVSIVWDGKNEPKIDHIIQAFTANDVK
ncbi:MAG: YraN family protein [Thermoguttaceae bacterium]